MLPFGQAATELDVEQLLGLRIGPFVVLDMLVKNTYIP